MAMKINIKPLGDRVLVEPLEATTKTASGIIIPETASKERSEQGVVVAVGPGKRNDDGKLVPLTIKKGDRVIFSKYGPDEIKLSGKDYFIISEANILAVID